MADYAGEVEVWQGEVPDFTIPEAAKLFRDYHAKELTRQGISVIFISSELPEIIGMCDRVLVMRSGELAGCVERERVTEEEIMYLATGVQ